MRRKDKILLTGAAVVGIGFLLYDLWKQWQEKQSKNEKLTWNNYDLLQGFKKLLGGAVLGVAGGYVYYEYKLSEEAITPFDSDVYLNKILSREHLQADAQLYQTMMAKRKEVKSWISTEFGSQLASAPEDAGSFAKKTAILSNYDLDIVVPFKRNSYYSLEEMYNDVYAAVDYKYGSKAIVTKHTKAISIEFSENDVPIYIDIVPGREINDYKIDKDLNLFVNKQSLWKSNSSFKTTIQKNVFTKNPQARKVVKLIKLYKEKNNLSLPSVIIDHSVDSEIKNTLDFSITENFLNGMNTLANKLTQKTLIDSSNSNNNLIDKLGDTDKEHISALLYRDIERIENDPRYLKEIFS